MDTAPLDRLLRNGISTQPDRSRPLFPGAVCGIDRGGDREFLAVGDGYRYADLAGTAVPEDRRTAVTTETWYDLASVTKLFTAMLIMQLVEQGELELDAPVANYLQAWSAPLRSTVTVRQLLTHTSGLAAIQRLWEQPDFEARVRTVLNSPLEAEPGSRFCYSCVGYLNLGLLFQALTGLDLGQAVVERICRPLGLGITYRPLAAGIERERIAATEMRPIAWSPDLDPAGPDEPAQDSRGIVHDENAASLNGIAGNAGLFGTASDLLIFGRAVLTGLGGGDSGLGLSAETLTEMIRPQLPDGLNPDFQQGLGFRIGQTGFMGRLADGPAIGHTGYTGTSITIDPSRDLVLVLLTNRVHPSRDWSEMNPFRAELSNLLA
jgi:CubicO group peptidase (beta-lactamase class C family)